MATHSNILTWETPGTEGPGGLQPMVPQRIGYDFATEHVCMLATCLTLEAKEFSWMVGSEISLHVVP